MLTHRIFMSNLHFFLNLYHLLPKNDTKKTLTNFRLKLTVLTGELYLTMGLEYTSP